MSLNHTEVLTAMRAIALAVPGFPSRRALVNREYEPDGVNPYAQEFFRPGTKTLVTASDAVNGTTQLTGLYVWQLFEKQGGGTSSLDTLADALLAAFYPERAIAVSSGALRVRGNPAPVRGEILRLDNGYAFVTVTIPFWALANN